MNVFVVSLLIQYGELTREFPLLLLGELSGSLIYLTEVSKM